MKKKKGVKNIASSVRERLLNISKKNNQIFDFVLLRYFQERLLYRISISAYKDKFILKGGLLFFAYEIPIERITKDIDLLSFIETNDIGDLKQIFFDIITIAAPDGVNFIQESLQVEPIRSKPREGRRIRLLAELAGAKLPLQIDIGFGDMIFPEPYEIKFPPLLDSPAPEIKIYSKETVIAEKLQAIVNRKILNSRMKDFYDIVYLSGMQDFNIQILAKAIETTFINRNTELTEISIIFEKDFRENINMQRKWTAFLHRYELSALYDFPGIIKQLELFLKPVFSKNSEKNQDMIWDKEKWQWS